MGITEEKVLGRRSLAGFTVFELLIAVAIVAILGAIAYPSFLGSVRKGRRSDAISALTSLQQAQERWRANNQSYSMAVADLGASDASAKGYYAISIASASGTGYVLSGTAVAGTSQAADTACTTMRLQLYNGAVLYGGCNACSPPSAPGDQVSDPNRCWAQ